jgi:streptogramin lyase
MRSGVRRIGAAVLGALVLASIAGAAGPPISEYKVASFPTSITAGPDGNLWFIDDNSNGYGKITPAGVISTWNWDSVAGGNRGLSEIAAGPDGNIWFTMCTFPSGIGKVTPAGVFTEYTAGLTSCPNGITAGPGGDMWFTETYGAIGKISTGGQVTEFDGSAHAGLLSPASHPIGIAQGSDGNLWFTEWGNNRIGKITAGGQLAIQYQLAAGTGPTQIVAGPDGNLWFTEDTADRIGKLTTGGALTEYSLTAGSSPEGITVGPDGNLWFAESSGGRIAKITTAGVVTEYGDNLASPTGIAAGADGNIWFTENTGSRVAKADIHPGAVGPNFSVGATPASATTAAGGSVQYTLTWTALGGYMWAGSLTADITGLPTGATWSKPGGTGSEVWTISTDASTPAGSYPLTFTYTDGKMTNSATATLVVTAAPTTTPTTPTTPTVKPKPKPKPNLTPKCKRGQKSTKKKPCHK